MGYALGWVFAWAVLWPLGLLTRFGCDCSEGFTRAMVDFEEGAFDDGE